jgi:hypothetical protein
VAKEIFSFAVAGNKLIQKDAAIEYRAKKEQTNCIAPQVFRWFERLCILINLLIIAQSFSLLVTFWIGNISPLSFTAVASPLLLLLIYFFIFKHRLIQKMSSHTTPKTWIYIVVLAIFIGGGLYLRYPTSAHIHGGQDQGSYFNIAAWTAKHGTYDRQDRILADAFNQNWPFAFNLVWNPYKTNKEPQELIPGEYEGERFIGGFTIKNRKKGEVVPQFYPLTPLLFTTSHWLFGAKRAADILPIFGILCVLTATLLAYRIWENTFVAGLVFMTLLVSGLEVFFSTFPVSEIISQYFIFSGTWFLLWAMESDNYSLPLLAGINFSVALFNHVTCVFYLAPIALFFILHRMICHNKAENKSILIFHYTFLAGSVASLVSARIYNGYYIYRNMKEGLSLFEPLQINGTFLLLFASVCFVALLPLAFYTKPGRYLETKPLWATHTLVALTVLTALLIISKTALYKFSIISFGEIKYTYFSSITTHISPFGWLVLLWGLFMSMFRSKMKLILFPILALLFFSFLFLYLAFETQYQWYFNRYYTKEFYPLAIIFIAYGIYHLSQFRFLEGLKGNILKALLGLLLILYSGYPNFYSFRHPFLDGAYDHMLALNSRIPNKSIILFVQGSDMYAPPDSELRLSVPLVYFFGHDVIWLPLRDDLARIVSIVTHYLHVYQRPLYLLYIGAHPLPARLLPPGAKRVNSQLHTFTEPERVNDIPKEQWRFKIGLHLYAL